MFPCWKENPLSAQVNDFEIQIVGLFTLGVSFSAEGNLITSDSTFFTPLSPAPNEISVGIVKVNQTQRLSGYRQICEQSCRMTLVLTLDEFAA